MVRGRHFFNNPRRILGNQQCRCLEARFGRFFILGSSIHCGMVIIYGRYRLCRGLAHAVCLGSWQPRRLCSLRGFQGARFRVVWGFSHCSSTLESTSSHPSTSSVYWMGFSDVGRCERPTVGSNIGSRCRCFCARGGRVFLRAYIHCRRMLRDALVCGNQVQILERIAVYAEHLSRVGQVAGTSMPVNGSAGFIYSIVL